MSVGRRLFMRSRKVPRSRLERPDRKPGSSPGDPSCHILPSLVYLVYSPTETQS
jgi:hypothetical protein